MDQPRGYIESIAGKRDAGTLLDFLIVHREHGPVGVTGLSELAPRDRRATVGPWVGHRYWGSGVNFSSKARIAALAIETLRRHPPNAVGNKRNRRSPAAL